MIKTNIGVILRYFFADLRQYFFRHINHFHNAVGYTDLQESIDKFVRMLREDIAGIRVIKALSKTGYEEEKYDALNKEVVTLEKKADCGKPRYQRWFSKRICLCIGKPQNTLK